MSMFLFCWGSKTKESVTGEKRSQPLMPQNHHP